MSRFIKIIPSEYLTFLQRPVFKLARRRWKVFTYIACLSFVASLAAMALPLVVKMMVDHIGKEFSMPTFFWMSLLFIFVMLVRTIISMVILWVSTMMRFSVTKELLEEIHLKIMRLPPSEVLQHRSGSLASHLLNDVEMLISGMESIINVSIRYPIEYIGLLSILFYISPMLAIVILLSAVAIAVVTIFKTKQLGKFQLNRNKEKANLFGIVNENIIHLKTIRAFNNVAHRIDFFRDHFEKLVGREKKLLFSQASFNLLSDIVIASFLLIAFLIVGVKLSSGALTVGSVIAAVVTLMTISSSLSKYSRSIANLRATMYAGKFIEDITSKIDQQSKNDKSLLSFNEKINAIQFADIRFSYENKEILKGINFTLSPGTPHFLIGENGAGKSTIIDLLFKFYIAGSGQIRINSHDYYELSESDVLSRMSVIPQVVTIFNDSVRYNLTFGNQHVSDQEIDEIIQKTGVQDILNKSDRTLGSLVGDRGGALSPGEMQRISLARALLRKPEVLFMDEPTNNLDPDTIDIIWKVIFEYAQDNIVLVITHQVPPNIGESKTYRLKDGEIQASCNRNMSMNRGMNV